MLIKILDKKTMGYDIPLDIFGEFGTLEEYDTTDKHEVIERCADADIIILNKVKITEEVIYKSNNLKLICVFATGYDNVDLNAARKRGIGVCNVPEYSTNSVALFTVATVLALCTRLREYSDFVTRGEYTKSGAPNYITPIFNEIAGKTWGIIGLGNIGKAVARVAEALGAKVIASKRTPDKNYTCVDIDDLCRESDIITVHTPLNDDTRGLIDEDKIKLMKKNVILVNEARGAVLNERDVADAIINKQIAYFGCDVYSTEPFDEKHPYNRIKDMSNVLLTPHSAWSSYEARVRCVNIIKDNIQSFIDGKFLNRVDK